MKFDSENPLPEVDVESAEYEGLKQHAAEMDSWLGYCLEEVEARVRTATSFSPGREYWTKQSVHTFSSPYLDIFHALKTAETNPQDVVVDLGCGYGRVGAVVALKFPGAGFVGFEAIQGRIDEAARILAQFSNLKMELKHADLRHVDFSETSMDGRKATKFFIYDFGSLEDFQFVFMSLRKFATKNPITVIARGGRSRDLIHKTEHWLCEVNPPRHFKRFSIYRS